MTLFKLQFAGIAKKVEGRMAGDKQILEVSLCKKVSKAGVEPPVFTWIKVTVWQPQEWMLERIAKGVFVSGCGDFSSRSYDGKDGKQTAMEVRCSSFDIEIADGAPSPAQIKPVAVAPSDDEPPL